MSAKPSKVKAKPAKAPNAKLDFMYGVLRNLYENAYGPAEAAAKFDADEVKHFAAPAKAEKSDDEKPAKPAKVAKSADPAK